MRRAISALLMWFVAGGRTIPAQAPEVRALADEYVRAHDAKDSAALRTVRRSVLARLASSHALQSRNDSVRVLASVLQQTAEIDGALEVCHQENWINERTPRRATPGDSSGPPPRVSELPSGVACYRALVRSYGGIDVSADSLIKVGLAELNDVERRMRTIAERSFNGASTDTILAAFRRATPFRDTAAVDSAARATLMRALDVSRRWFASLPTRAIAIHPMSGVNQASPLAMYASGSATPSSHDSALVLLNYGAILDAPAAALEPLLFHEGVPGHHLQIGMANGQPVLHPIFALSPRGGFAEGWALYAEGLADEMGLVRNDTTRLLLLNSERQRAARLIADAGVAVKAWSSDSTVAFLCAHGMSTSQAAGEFQRYLFIPGQGTSYTLGMLAIRAARAHAQRTQGKSFDLRAFHSRLLKFGGVPTGSIPTVAGP